MSLRLPDEIERLTEEELRACVADVERSRTLREIYRDAIARLNREIERLDSMFADFTVRSGSMMTAAALFSFFPFVSIASDPLLMRHFVVWVFPFVLVALASFLIGLSRVQVRVTAFPSIHEGSEDELPTMRAEVRQLKDALEKKSSIYDRVLFAEQVCGTSLTLYGVAFVIHYVLFLFGDLPDTMFSAIIFAVIALYGLIHIRGNLKLAKEEQFGPFETKTTVLGLPPSQKL